MRDPRDFLSVPGERDEPPNVALGEAKTVRIEVQLNLTILSDLGYAVWRLRQKMFDQESGAPKEEFRQLSRHVSTISDRLADIGLQIQDHTGDAFDSGQSLEVLAFQPTPGVDGEKVIETVRPTVYLSGHRILKGQVIVGIPENSTTDNQKP
jgi:hypothetical protein